jgi:hypothetical protein
MSSEDIDGLAFRAPRIRRILDIDIQRGPNGGGGLKIIAACQHQECIERIIEAMREATRASRVLTAAERIAEGRMRSWKGGKRRKTLWRQVHPGRPPGASNGYRTTRRPRPQLEECHGSA